VWVELADSEGIQVWIALPLQAETHSDADLSRIRETVDTRLEAGADSTPKILLQAESEPLRGMLAENLIEGGYDVVSAQESVDVLRLARREIPDLIILDLQSRNPSAMDLALILRGERDFSTIPMLFLTEIAGPGIGRRMDTVDFLVQPQGADAILQTVDQVLRKGLRLAERIMVVEQDDGLREEMLQTIQAQGYPVVEARSAEEALALAERVDIRLVLANYNLAHARDYWLVRQLRQLSEQIEIYLMTEGAQSIDAQVALRKGVTGYGDTGRLRELLAKADEETNSPDEVD
jgi:DNA-binding response OmpR family regulator